MTWHGDCHVHIDLQLVCNPLVDCERVCRLAEEVFSQLVPDEKADAGCENERQDASSRGS